MTAVAPAGASQVCVCTFVDRGALPRYPGAMQRQLDRLLLRRTGRARPARRPLCRRGSWSWLRLPLRLWLRPFLRSCLRRSIGSRGRKHRSQRGLRAKRFADISTQPPHRNIRLVRGALVLSISSLAPLALGAFAIASALAPQRFAGSTAPIALGATAIASALARQRLIASALASQRSGVKQPRAWRLA